VLDRVFPFTECRAAFDHMAGQSHFGKIAIRVG
jgi:NADPH:quinone reductase-like Zn-dependent oxidoreductase